MLNNIEYEKRTDPHEEQIRKQNSFTWLELRNVMNV